MGNFSFVTWTTQAFLQMSNLMNANLTMNITRKIMFNILIGSKLGVTLAERIKGQP